MRLPERFEHKMRELLQDEYMQFAASYSQPRTYGLRINTLKTTVGEFAPVGPFQLDPIPWVDGGFYYVENERPGKHPYYHAGLYYIQEPSAMLPVELLEIKPGEKVLDLCAAPGGKTTQIAAKLQQEGLLVTNDPHTDRVKALVKNVELAGIRNAVVLNETPGRLAQAFPEFFDKILVDAPCSGEGMFRKEEDMAKEWNEDSPAKYAAMQWEIMLQAEAMLAPGGRIVYSTCTFSPVENEAIITRFLDRFPSFRVVSVERPEWGFAPGRPDWTGAADNARLAQVRGTVRLWPHRVRGEGHFAAVLERSDASSAPLLTDERMREKEKMSDGKGEWLKEQASRAGNSSGDRSQRGAAGLRRTNKKSDKLAARGKRNTDAAAVPELNPLRQFMHETLYKPLDGPFICYGSFIYAASPLLPSERLDRLKAVRPGWFVGELKSGRFTPSHALAMALAPEHAVRRIHLAADSQEAIRYLKGETLIVDADRIMRSHSATSIKGFTLVCIEAHPVGWGKWLDGILKSEYPPGWRLT